MGTSYWEENFRKEYYAWRHMKQRCRNPNDPDYHNYGAIRGVSESYFYDSKWESLA